MNLFPQRLPSADVSRSDSGGGIEDDYLIVAPPDLFSGDNCATPTPGDFGTGTDSGCSTPRLLDSPLVDMSSKASPLATYLMKAERGGSSDTSKEISKPRVQTSNLAHSIYRAPGGTPQPRDVSDNQPQSPTNPEFSKLSIAPHDSPMAAATNRVLGILSSSNHTPKPSERGVAEGLDPASAFSLFSRESSAESRSSDRSSDSCEGTDM